jgi:hypothetical protein
MSPPRSGSTTARLAARPDARRAPPAPAVDDAEPLDGDGAAPSPLVALLDAAEEAGSVDHRRVADLLECAPARVRAALAAPEALALGQDTARVASLARALGADPALVRDAVARMDARLRSSDAGGAAAVEATAPRGTAADAGTVAAVPDPPAPSTLALLERLVLAVDPSTRWGPTARLALIDAAERTACQAGRAVPPALHALRARVRGAQAAAEPDAVPGGGRVAVALDAAALDLTALDVTALDASAHAAPILAGAAATVRLLQQASPGYDGLFAPVHDDDLAVLLRRHGLHLHTAALGRTSAVVVTPPLWGRAVVLVSDGASADQRRVALRVALAHVAAGDVRESVPLSAPASDPQRGIAELAALADLIPFWQLADLRRRGRMGWRTLETHLADVAASLAGDWPAARAAAHAVQRVALYRSHGL